MAKHRYRITVAEVSPAQDETLSNQPPLQFEVESPEDWHQTLQRAEQLNALDARSKQAFVIGLKLFGGVMLENRSHPLFADFAPHFGQFMRQLKGKDRRRTDAE